MKYLWLFDEKRLAILRELLHCDAARGCDIKECLGIKKSLLSHHLSVLREKGMIEERREGREKYYRIRRGQRPFVKKIMALVE